MSGGRVTHQQIAELAGVSRGLVTAALHRTRGQRMSDETRQMILNIAQELNYRPRNVTTHSIGLVLKMDSLQLEGETAFVMAVDRALRMRQFRLTLACLNEDDVPSLPDTLNPKTVDGILMTRWYDGAFQPYISSEIPWVLTSDEYHVDADLDDGIDVVTIDVWQTVSRIARYLFGFGHERICVVAGPEYLAYHRRIRLSLQQAMRETGLPEKNFSSVEVKNNEQVAEPLVEVMRQPNRPTAIIVGSSEMALTVFYMLRTLDLEVPGDVSIVSIFDSPRFKATRPELTATTAYGFEVADQAVKRLLEKIESPGSPARKLYIPGELIERGSVGAAPANV